MKTNPTAYAAMAEAIRCTDFIPELDIRAKYIITDMRLRGFIVQKVRIVQEGRRDSRGRFQPVPR